MHDAGPMRLLPGSLVLLVACATAANEAPIGAGEAAAPAGARDDGGAEEIALEAGVRFVDTCKLQASSCPGSAGTEGSGLTEIDRCAFGLVESAGLGTTPAFVAELEAIAKPVTVSDVLADANRVATLAATLPGGPTPSYAIQWQSDDQNSTAWTPQGITGTADADPSGLVEGNRAVVVSFYDDPPAGETNDGVRLAFVNLTDPDQPRYRFVLLVAPKAGPSFDPVRVHAGGIAWFGSFLYVADTSHGFRVFDLRHPMQVATDAGDFGCAAGTCRAGTYKYVLPQIGTYDVTSACAPIFSWVSLDRSSTPPSLVSGEYCSTTACAGPLAGRVYRWPIDVTTGLLRSATTFPSAAYLMGQKQVQGGAARDDTFWFSSSAPAGGGGAIYRVKGARSTAATWPDAPEDLMIDGAQLWGITEAAGARFVFTAAQP